LRSAAASGFSALLTAGLLSTLPGASALVVIFVFVFVWHCTLLICANQKLVMTESLQALPRVRNSAKPVERTFNLCAMAITAAPTKKRRGIFA
jgi:hypothetical protein